MDHLKVRKPMNIAEFVNSPCLSSTHWFMGISGRSHNQMNIDCRVFCEVEFGS